MTRLQINVSLLKHYLNSKMDKRKLFKGVIFLQLRSFRGWPFYLATLHPEWNRTKRQLHFYRLENYEIPHDLQNSSSKFLTLFSFVASINDDLCCNDIFHHSKCNQTCIPNLKSKKFSVKKLKTDQKEVSIVSSSCLSKFTIKKLKTIIFVPRIALKLFF